LLVKRLTCWNSDHEFARSTPGRCTAR